MSHKYYARYTVEWSIFHFFDSLSTTVLLLYIFCLWLCLSILSAASLNICNMIRLQLSFGHTKLKFIIVHFGVNLYFRLNLIIPVNVIFYILDNCIIFSCTKPFFIHLILKNSVICII